ncbi:hypothetical protein ORI20_15705 [Mycobacterium sp. CVI_P3]|uniref:F5/8 type C domain-containing protein n=1 Tax=Mycobacterium pinniadriaticum TaxID=2994102 RepID=A0ABT3SFC7_9MYCO|nr:hypothetical protein [Mycobacterium pinniadriaticum]MCX2931727.1 hypothetical protein [Mycobacterium pinniadriaticum]MCX2938198.1 hypothetical protein [Mycobacterium pinniadriaticum]
MGKAEVAPEDTAWLTRIRGTNADPDSPDEGDDGYDEWAPEGQADNNDSTDDDDGWPIARTEPISRTEATAQADLDSQRIIDLDAADDEDDTDTGDDTAAARRRFNPAVAAGFVGTAVLATVVTLIAGSVASRDEPAPPPTPTSHARPPLPPPPPSVPPAAVDGPLRFTATSDCDRLPGSTSAQLLADPQSSVPWICASQIPGQVLKIYLDQPYIITAVSIVPGAVNKMNPTDDGDAWLRHRVVTRLQWQFNDRANTIKSQKTGDVHGEAVEPIPSTLASEITVIIQETSRPPQVAAPTTTPTSAPGSDGILGPILGSNGPQHDPADEPPLLPGQAERPDPSDGTFAVSSIQIMGHKVI